MLRSQRPLVVVSSFLTEVIILWLQIDESERIPCAKQEVPFCIIPLNFHRTTSFMLKGRKMNERL